MKKYDSKTSNISSKSRRYPLVFATITAFMTVCSAGVSTFAWFQAESRVRINTTSSEANITVQAPESVKFYYFKGNGVPGSAEYTGYSKSNASFGNTTNVVNTSDGTYKTAAISYTSIATFANAWVEINLSSESTTSGVASPKNCFNFNRMRPGCYYSFCIESNLATSTVNIDFAWNGGSDVTGNSTSPKRFVYNGGATLYPLNLLMAMHGYCKNLNTTDATTYIKESLGVGSTLSLTDKITFASDVGTGTTSAQYPLLSSASTSTNKYIYFTIFMGKQDKSDALAYQTTEGGIRYYQRNVSTGSYSALDGLKSTLSSIAIS